MSGNLWMFSDMLDDEDIEMLKRDYITYYQGADYYGLGLKVFTRMAHEAGAVYKIGKKVLVRREIFEEYLRIVWQKKEEEREASEAPKNLFREGVLVEEEETGRIDVRFGLDDYFGGLRHGTRLEVFVDGEWVQTKIEMKDGWRLTGIPTDQLPGLIVKLKC